MNPHIHDELRRLKVHLQRHPEQALQLAIAHLEDYLILLNEYKHLQHQINLLRQDRTFSISPTRFIDAQLTLEQQLRVEIFKRNLASQADRDLAKFWAMKYFRHFLDKSESYRQTRAELLSLCLPQHQPQLPYFL